MHFPLAHTFSFCSLFRSDTRSDQNSRLPYLFNLNLSPPKCWVKFGSGAELHSLSLSLVTCMSWPISHAHVQSSHVHAHPCSPVNTSAPPWCICGRGMHKVFAFTRPLAQHQELTGSCCKSLLRVGAWNSFSSPGDNVDFCFVLWAE